MNQVLGTSEDLRLELVQEPGRLAAIGDEWNALWLSADGSVFQSHAWISAWSKSFAPSEDARLHIALAWRGERLAGVLPFAVRRRKGVRTLEWAAQSLSDYCDILCAPGSGGAAAAAALWARAYRAGGFDLVHLRQLRPDARFRRVLDLPGRNAGRLQARERRDVSLQLMNRWPNGQAYFRSLNKKARNNHTRGKRIISEQGPFASRKIDSDEQRASLVEWIFAQKIRWLRESKLDSPLLVVGPKALHNMIDALAKTGRLAIFVLECGDRPVAASVNIVEHGRMLAFLTTYDAAFDRASPGTILMVDYAMWAFDNGIIEIDYLRGDEPFKLRFANASTELIALVGGRTLLGYTVLAIYRGRTALLNATTELVARMRMLRGTQPVARSCDDGGDSLAATRIQTAHDVP